MKRSTSRAAGAMASFAALATMACPLVSSASALSLPPMPPQPLQQTVSPVATVPPAVQQSVQQLLGDTPHAQLPPSVTTPIVGLLTQAASTPGVPAQVGGALTQLAAALSSGNPPTAAQIASDLRSLALTPGLPSQVSSELNSLADTFDGGSSGSSGGSGGGAYGGSAGNGTAGTNGTDSGIPGFAGSKPFGAQFNPNSPQASGRTDSRMAGANGAVIMSVRYNDRRHTVRILVVCRAKTDPCNTAVAVYAGRRRVTTPAAKTLIARRKATFTMRTTTRAARRLANHGGVLRAVAVSNTPYGQAHSAKSVHVKPIHH